MGSVLEVTRALQAFSHVVEGMWEEERRCGGAVRRCGAEVRSGAWEGGRRERREEGLAN